MVAAGAVQHQALVQRLGLQHKAASPAALGLDPAQAGHRTHVQRIQIQFFGRMLQCAVDGGQETVHGLPGDAVDQIQIQRWNVLGANDGDRPLHRVALLRPHQCAHFGSAETLDAHADPINAGLPADPQPLGIDGFRRHLDAGRNGVQRNRRVAVHHVEHALQLRRIQIARRAAAHRKAHEAVRAQRLHGGAQLLLHLRQIRLHLRRRRPRQCEQIAEPAAVRAERNMQVQKQRLPGLVGPDLRQRHGRLQRPVAGLVRIRVRIGLIRRLGQQFGQRRQAHGVTRKWA